jgi:hypothetical protein
VQSVQGVQGVQGGQNLSADGRAVPDYFHVAACTTSGPAREPMTKTFADVRWER